MMYLDVVVEEVRTKKTGIWNPGCGGCVGGKSALSHYKDGIFGTPRVTTWERGTNQEVLWESKAYHRGGYAYRLCKVKKGKIWKVNEKCFQKGHLKFASNTTWSYYEEPTGPLRIWLKSLKILNQENMSCHSVGIV